MNRNIFLILSAVTVIILLSIWVYLLFFSNQAQAPQEPVQGSGAFNEFDLGTDAANPLNQNNSDSEPDTTIGENPNNYDPEILRQLTTKNVIGYSEVLYASTTFVYFMESGVGHIYSIDLSTGEEKRISATTIPDAREADFSPNGEYVAVKVGKDTGPNDLFFGTLNLEDVTVETTKLANSVTDFSFTKDNVLLYANLTNTSVVANSFEPVSEVNEVLFVTPFREASVRFTDIVAGPHYFFPKTSSLLEGFVYQVIDGTTTRLPADGYGLSANASLELLLVSKREKANFVSDLFLQESKDPIRLSKSFIPEKCLINTVLYCAGSDTSLKYNATDEWLKGKTSFNDSLWSIREGEPVELIDISAFSGREVDVYESSLGYRSSDWYFKNKQDNALWIFELSRLTTDSN